MASGRLLKKMKSYMESVEDVGRTDSLESKTPNNDSHGRPGLPPIATAVSRGHSKMCTSDRFVERRAQAHLEQMLKDVVDKKGPLLPDINMGVAEVTNAAHRPQVSLTTLDESVQEHFRRLALLELQAWKRSSEGRAQEKKRAEALKERLRDWYETRDVSRLEKEQREKELELEKQRAQTQDRKRWKKRGERLQQKVAAWGAEKAEREMQEARRARELEEEAKKRAKQQRSKRRRRKDQRREQAQTAAETLQPEQVTDCATVALKVEMILGGTLLECDFPSTKTVAVLKEDLERQTGIVVSMQRLLSQNGVVLEDAASIEDVQSGQVATEGTVEGSLRIMMETLYPKDPLVRCRETGNED